MCKNCEQNSFTAKPKDDLSDRVHPELRDALAAKPAGLITADTVGGARVFMNNAIKQMTAHLPKSEQIKTSVQIIPGLPGEPDVEIRIYQPKDAKPGIPGMLSIHGGGFILGSAEGEELGNIFFAEQFGCTVISPEYRLSPENHFPAALNDCYATLLWFAENAPMLGVDSNRIVVSGGSAGGGMAAALAIKARDEGGPAIAAQFLCYPMLDYRNITPSSNEITDTRVWDRKQNIVAWEMYLGGLSTEKITPLASPALLEKFEGLPPAFISVGTMDAFRDECIQYASNLLAADVDVELHVYPGVFHGADGLAPCADIVLRMADDRRHAVTKFFSTGHF